MRLRGVLVLAIFAALLGAPPTASAATNLLHSPEASPVNGTTATLFRLRVAYDGQVPASGVEAIVGGQSVAMSLVSGSTTDGTWEGWVSLPIGTWPVTFVATAGQGPDPTLLGPTLFVADIIPTSTPAPDEPQSPDGSGAMPTMNEVEAPAPGPGPKPTAPLPAPSETSTSAGRPPGNDGAPSAPTPSVAPPEPGDAAPHATDHERGGAGEAGHGAVAGGGASPEPAGDPVRDTGEPGATPDGAAVPLERGRRATPAPAAGVDDGLAVDALRVSAVWGAMLLLAGAIMLGLLLRRRRREAADADAIAVAAETEALLERRALRRARVVLPEDQIVAALGIDDPDPAERQSRRRGTRRRSDEDEP